jgi:hypothetical protein
MSVLFGLVLQFQVDLQAALRRLMAVALAAGLVFAPLPAAFASGAPETAMHASFSAHDAAEHGHSHGDDEPMEPPRGHAHGHDPADHSHQYAFLSAGSSQWGLPAAQPWRVALSGRPDAALGLGIERPPKQVQSL